jgi:hypothetical protein
MKIIMLCTCIAIAAASLAAIEARAQVQTAPKVTTPEIPKSGQTPTAPPPHFMVDFSIQMPGKAPPGYVGSFPAISVVNNKTVTPVGKIVHRSRSNVEITRRPDGYSKLFKQLVNRAPAKSTLTITVFMKGKAYMQEIFSTVTLTSMTQALNAQNQQLERLTFEFREVKEVRVAPN